jgi:hypothetical protein
MKQVLPLEPTDIKRHGTKQVTKKNYVRYFCTPATTEIHMFYDLSTCSVVQQLDIIKEQILKDQTKYDSSFFFLPLSPLPVTLHCNEAQAFQSLQV